MAEIWGGPHRKMSYIWICKFNPVILRLKLNVNFTTKAIHICLVWLNQIYFYENLLKKLNFNPKIYEEIWHFFIKTFIGNRKVGIEFYVAVNKNFDCLILISSKGFWIKKSIDLLQFFKLCYARWNMLLNRI